ncbi:hypothetical protein EHM76_05585 [bacterium]|nr:MAG: hypothetical protein EHM76_05585 [bacterium]
MIDLERYKQEDPKWTPQVLMTWLVERKQIPIEIAQWAFEDTLKEDINIPSHHGQDGFDNYVLKKARKFTSDLYDLSHEQIEKKWQERVEAHTEGLKQDINKRLSGNRWKKAWKALRGKL